MSGSACPIGLPMWMLFPSVVGVIAVIMLAVGITLDTPNVGLWGATLRRRREVNRRVRSYMMLGLDEPTATRRVRDEMQAEAEEVLHAID